MSPNSEFREGEPPIRPSDSFREGEPSIRPGSVVSSNDHELSEHAQRRNSLVFFLNTSVGYFVAPVFYIGMLHVAIVNSLEFSDTIANLPESVYMWMAPFPLLIAWLWPSMRHLRRMLVASYLFKALAGVVTASLFLSAPPVWIVVAIVVHAAVIGITNGVTNMCLWELIGRGMSPARRAWTLGFTYGVGPICAVLGSFATQLVLNGNFENLIFVTPIPKPWSYIVLFGVTGPAMMLSAVIVRLAHVPPSTDGDPAPGIDTFIKGLRQYVTHPLILITVAAFLLTYAGGSMLLNNLVLFIRDATGEKPEDYAGTQMVLRFGFKCVGGFVLGWILARTHAKASLVLSTAISLAGVCWALLIPGKWYLLSIGLVGAGELFYVYYVNYIVGCSAPERIRENMAYTNLIAVSVGFMPLVYGGVSDRFGLTASFFVALGILVVALLIVCLFLPSQPSVQETD